MNFRRKPPANQAYRQATVDHIDARALGGGEGVGNIQIICRGCNRAKGEAEDMLVRWQRAKNL